MKIQWLNFFSVHADKLNLRESAHICNVAVSTLQLNLKQLEKELGVALFQNQYTELTEAGLFFQSKALNLISILERVSRISEPQSSRKIVLGWTGFWGHSLLHDFIKQIPPDLFNTFYLQRFNRSQEYLISAYQQDILDIVLTSYSINQKILLPKRPKREHIMLIGPRTTFQIVGHPEHSPAKWNCFEYILLPPSQMPQAPIIWNDSLFPRQIQLVLPSFNVIKWMCRNSDYVSYLPQSLVQFELDQAYLSIVSTPPEEASVNPCIIITPHYFELFSEILFDLGFYKIKEC